METITGYNHSKNSKVTPEMFGLATADRYDNERKGSENASGGKTDERHP